jgi:hypothetical protein
VTVASLGTCKSYYFILYFELNAFARKNKTIVYKLVIATHEWQHFVTRGAGAHLFSEFACCATTNF